jgi:Spy/CpxP family protein refolding chaperone
MCKWMRSATVIGILLLTGSVAGAQGRHDSRWWNTPATVAALKLNDGEIQRLNQQYDASRLRMIKLKSEVETEQFKLQVMLEKADLDESALETQDNNLEKARANLSKERFAFFVQVRKIIGPKRFAQLMETYTAHRRDHK